MSHPTIPTPEGGCICLRCLAREVSFVHLTVRMKAERRSLRRAGEERGAALAALVRHEIYR